MGFFYLCDVYIGDYKVVWWIVAKLYKEMCFPPVGGHIYNPTL